MSSSSNKGKQKRLFIWVNDSKSRSNWALIQKKPEQDSLIGSRSFILVMQTSHKPSFKSPGKPVLQLLCIIGTFHSSQSIPFIWPSV